MTNPATYFREYRKKIGFTNQNDAKLFLAAKDIIPLIDYEYIDALCTRIKDVITRINGIIPDKYRPANLSAFFETSISHTLSILKEHGLLSKLNNQKRRPEDVLFSWLRGYVVCEYFIPSLSAIFSIPATEIMRIGDDSLQNINTFKRTPTADLKASINGTALHLEIQSGFQGTNDIKEHKIREAKRIYAENGIKTVCVHIDLYNGQVAFVQINKIEDDDVNFVTRQQMEGQSVLSIDQNYFKWRLLDAAPTLMDLELDL